MTAVEMIVWALLTGGITGGVWVAVVLLDRQRRLAAELERAHDRLARLEDVEARLLDAEGRLDFTERVLAQPARPAEAEPGPPRDPAS